MNTKTPHDFRTHAEMDAIYKQLSRKGKADDPYIVRVSAGRQMLIFFGARHSNDVKDPQNQKIETLWREFMNHPNTKKVAMCEGGLRPLETSKADAIKRHSEAGLLTWLAKQDGISLVSPEPDMAKEVEYLADQGHDIAAIVTYYFGRQMYQWIERDKINNPDWETYAIRHIAGYTELQQLLGEQLSLKSSLQMFEQTTGKTFDLKDEKLLFSICDPTSNSVSSSSSDFRNLSLYMAIRDAWHDGKDVFAIYGSGHVVVLENALKS